MRKTIILLMISLSLFALVVIDESDNPEATAFNNQRKVRYFGSEAGKIGAVYSGYGYVWYGVSEDNGATWSTGTVEEGDFPGLDVRVVYGSLPVDTYPGALEKKRYPYFEWDVVWNINTDVYAELYACQSAPRFSEVVPSFGSPLLLMRCGAPETGGVSFSPPAIEADGKLYHVVWEVVRMTEEPPATRFEWFLLYARYDTNWEMVDTMEVIDHYIYTQFPEPRSPSVTCDMDGNPHVVYEKNDTV